MATRARSSSSTVGEIAGDDFLDEYAGHVDTLYDAGCFPLTSIGGTGDVVTATLDPALDAGGFADGMRFTLTWGAANTGAVTLAINGGSALAVVSKTGDALVGGDLASGLRSMIEYVGGDFVILTEVGAAAGGGVAASYEAFTSSGTWTKPAGIADDQVVIVELWGAGGGGGRSGSSVDTATGGGGGGGYLRREFRAADLPSSVSVTIGAGGAGKTATVGVGSAGGNSTFGALMTAYGGGGGAGGASSGNGRGGGGGGELAAGGNAVGGGAVGAGGAIGGADGGSGAAAGDARSIWGGGGGNRGKAAFGGGGGGYGAAGGDGGASVFGGDGGSGGNGAPAPTAGSAPGGGGGGGSNAADGANGARGECRVWIMGA